MEQNHCSGAVSLGAEGGLVQEAVAGLLLGLSVGAMQWLALRRRIAGAAWWIPATAGGFILAGIVGGALRGWLSRKPSASLASVAVIAGVGQVLVTIGFLISEPPALWSLMGGGVTIVAYPIWAISMGRWLLRQPSTNQIAESVIVS